MKRLEVLFPDSQHATIEETSKKTEPNKSKLCRAAMEIGLQKINDLAEKDLDAAQELIAISDFKSRR